jgi:ABC-type transport system involved in multi-copper enzyme maturation permease subunit
MSPRLLAAIAANTFRESVRDRVFYNLLLFAVVLVGASLVIGQLAAGQDVKIIKDLGLAAALLFGVGIAIFIGIQLVAREVERRSVYVTLSKPVPRPVYLFGKYLGLLLTLGVNIAVMTGALFTVLFVYWRLPSIRRCSSRCC